MSSQNETEGILNSDSRIVGFGNAPSSKNDRSGCIGKVTSLVLFLISAALAIALAVTLLRGGEGTASQSGPSPGLLACYQALRDIAVNQTEVYYNAAAFVSFPQYNIPPLLPYFTVLPTTVEQIQRALKCAKRYNLKVSIKGGGHNYAGFSQAPLGGFQISLQSMRNFSYVNFNGTPALRTQPGVAFGDTYGFLNEYHPDLLLAGGLCPSVGIVGFHLGGGIGPLSRLYGVGCDNLLQATMLTVNGSELVIANETSNPDLFWALRGGGGPSFGVVVEMIIRLNPNPHQNFSYGEFCVGTDIGNITANLQKYAAQLAIEDFPDWLTVHWRLVKRRPPKLSGLCYLIYSIRNASETEAAIARSIGKNQVFQSQGPLKGDPEWAFIQEHPTYMEMVAANAVYKGYERFATYPETYACAVLPALNNSIINMLVQSYTQMPDVNDGDASCYIQGMEFGGAVSTVPRSATAFSWRDRISYSSDASCNFESAAQEADATRFLSMYQRVSKPYSGGVYLNFPILGLDGYAKAYWSDNLERLQQIRQYWNPDRNNALNFPQAVPLPGAE